jgi:hypothetical protein
VWVIDESPWPDALTAGCIRPVPGEIAGGFVPLERVLRTRNGTAGAAGAGADAGTGNDASPIQCYPLGSCWMEAVAVWFGSVEPPTSLLVLKGAVAGGKGRVPVAAAAAAAAVAVVVVVDDGARVLAGTSPACLKDKSPEKGREACFQQACRGQTCFEEVAQPPET